MKQAGHYLIGNKAGNASCATWAACTASAADHSTPPAARTIARMPALSGRGGAGQDSQHTPGGGLAPCLCLRDGLPLRVVERK